MRGKKISPPHLFAFQLGAAKWQVLNQCLAGVVLFGVLCFPDSNKPLKEKPDRPYIQRCTAVGHTILLSS